MKWLIGIGTGFAGIIVGAGAMIANGADADTGSFGSVVGIEQHQNPEGDRYVNVISPVGVFGIWVTDDCAATLSLGDDWPSLAPECAN